MVRKVNELKKKDETLYKDKVEELKKKIGEDKVQKKLAEFESKYGDEIENYVNKVRQFKKNATNEEIAELILDMKNKLDKSDQKKFDKLLKFAKSYLKDI